VPDASADFQRLAPYVLGRARRGVVGSSRYAQRLRTAVLDAARDAARRPVLISGEPGLEKDNLAALIHFGSRERRRLLLRLDTADLQGSGRQLLDHLGENSLLVSGIDRMEPRTAAAGLGRATPAEPRLSQQHPRTGTSGGSGPATSPSGRSGVRSLSV